VQSRAGECANNHVVKLKPRDIAYLFDLYPGLRELHRKKVPEGAWREEVPGSGKWISD
jgi:hypothetical protein